MGRAPNRPRSIEGGRPPASAPHRVRLPVNLHRWDDITFLHWPYPPEVRPHGHGWHRGAAHRLGLPYHRIAFEDVVGPAERRIPALQRLAAWLEVDGEALTAVGLGYSEDPRAWA